MIAACNHLLIGLYATCGSTHDSLGGNERGKLAELALLQMLSGAIKPRHGTAACTRRVVMVGQGQPIFNGTLMENLAYDARRRDIVL